MILLPPLTARSDYAPLRHQVAPSAAAMATIAERHRLAALTPAGTGTHVVWWNATVAVKLFLPLYPTDGPREARVARALAGRLPVRTPQVLHEGTLEGWVYLVFDRLPGRTWRETGGTPSLARQVGQVVAALREVPTQGLAEADASWAEYLAFQEGAWLERQRGYGTPERLLSELEALVASTPRPPPARLSLLHADLHREGRRRPGHRHLRLRRLPGRGPGLRAHHARVLPDAPSARPAPGLPGRSQAGPGRPWAR